MNWHEEYVDECPSTNAELLERDRLAHGTVLIANAQSAGRGRLGRQWSSPAGTQAIISVGLLPADVSRFGLLPLAAGLALVDALPEVRLKWPNDGLLHGKKVAGILCEAAADDASPCGMRVVIGMGINVSLTEFPVETATSLHLEGIDLSLDDVRTRVVRSLSRRYDQWADGYDLIPEYTQACASIGQHVRLIAPGGDITGTVDGIAPDGSVIVGGKAYSAGDVIHLRPHH